MKKQFATYEISLALKELGFDKECFGWYYLNNPDYIEYERCKLKDCIDIHIPATLWQQCRDWFRETHGIHIDLDFGIGWGYGFIPIGAIIEYDWSHFEDNHNWGYEEAREAAILKAIEIIKNK